MVGLSGDSTEKSMGAGAKVSWPFTVSSDTGEVILGVDIHMSNPDDAPEWEVTLNDTTGEIWENKYSSKSEVSIDCPGKGDKQLTLWVECPKGARFDDFIEVTVKASASGGSRSMVFRATAKQSIVALKTQIDQEKTVADLLAKKASEGDKDIYAILCPDNLKGYIFVEGMNTDRMREKARDIKKARNFIAGETSIDEVAFYLTPLSPVIGITEGDLVELVNGPFKGEKARVQQIDESKEEITVELIEAMVPIPVTVKGDSVRVIEKEK